MKPFPFTVLRLAASCLLGSALIMSAPGFAATPASAPTTTPSAPGSKTVDPESAAIIDELAKLLGMARMNEVAAEQMSLVIIQGIGRQQTVTPPMQQAIREEVTKVIDETFVKSGWMREMLYQVYGQRFTAAELKQLLDFYQTPVGQKMLVTMPQIAAESMRMGELKGQEIVPLLRERVTTRFKAEGFEMR